MFFGQSPAQLFTYPHCRRENFRIKPTLFTRLLTKTRYEFCKKCIIPVEFTVICTENFLILLRVQEKVLMTKFKWSSQGVFDNNSIKDNELEGVYPSNGFLAVIYEDIYIVSSGYNDYSIVIHDLSGLLIKVLKFHSTNSSCLCGGNWIISGSNDSTLVLWTKTDTLQLYGHITGILSVTGNHQYCIIASCSEYILTHNSRTGEVLNKINEKCSKIMSNSYGHFFAHVKNELKIFHLNGNIIKSIPHHKQKQFLPFQEFLILEDRQFIKIFSTFEDGYKAQIYMQDPLELTQVIYYADRNVLLLINASENYTLYSLDMYQDHLTDISFY